MRRLLLVGMVVGLFLVGRQPANAAGLGPVIAVGTPSFSSGLVTVPILIDGASFQPYRGFNIHLTWDPSLLAFSSYNTTGGTLDSPFCVLAQPNAGGVVIGCVSMGLPTTATGLAANIVLAPYSVGCTFLHLFTTGLPDGGDEYTGTYTVNSGDYSIQSNTYVDRIFNTGCQPPSDSDGDGMPDDYEAAHPCLDSLIPDGLVDADDDGVTNIVEMSAGIDPCSPDSDADGYTDGQEMTMGKDPKVPCPTMRADVNYDAVANILDLARVASQFGQPIPPGIARYDQNADNKINLLDLARQAAVFGQNVTSCP